MPVLQDRLLRLFWGFRPYGPYEIALVNLPVQLVQWEQRFPFSLRGHKAVIGVGTGDWDSLVSPFDETPLFQSLERRFVRGEDWQDTPLFRRAVSNFSAGKKSWNSCHSEAELLERCHTLDRLYDDMSANGYRRQHESEWTNSLRGTRIPDEPRVAISRDGRAIRCAAGRHRIAMAMLLGIAEIPVLVQIRHASAPLVGERIHAVSILK